jgi:hypothetical protein
MVARANVSFSAGGASYRLDGTRRDDDTIAPRHQPARAGRPAGASPAFSTDVRSHRR